MATSWFKYNCSGSITDTLSYTLVSLAPNCPAPKVDICAIFADIQIIGGVQRPVITTALQSSIQIADLFKVESSNVRLKPHC